MCMAPPSRPSSSASLVRRWRDSCGRTRRARLAGDRIIQDCRQSKHHPRLRPSHVGRPYYAGSKHPVIEEPSRVAHVLERPFEDPLRQRKGSQVEVLQLDERNEALSDAMDVDRISPIVKILRCAVFTKEAVQIEVKTASQMRTEFRRTQVG